MFEERNRESNRYSNNISEGLHKNHESYESDVLTARKDMNKESTRPAQMSILQSNTFEIKKDWS